MYLLYCAFYFASILIPSIPPTFSGLTLSGRFFVLCFNHLKCVLIGFKNSENYNSKEQHSSTLSLSRFSQCRNKFECILQKTCFGFDEKVDVWLVADQNKYYLPRDRTITKWMQNMQPPDWPPKRCLPWWSRKYNIFSPSQGRWKWICDNRDGSEPRWWCIRDWLSCVASEQSVLHNMPTAEEESMHFH